MKEGLQLLGYLILTVLSIIVPFVLVLLTMFREGIDKLTKQYETQRFESEKNIKEQMKKISTDPTNKVDITNIEESISELKNIEKTANKKLNYLLPKKQILRLFALFFVSFIGIVAAIINGEYALTLGNVTYYILIISAGCFVLGIIILWKMFCVIIEAKQFVDAEIKSNNVKTIELLSKIADMTMEEFLKHVYIDINNSIIKEENETTGKKVVISLPPDKESKLNVKISNRELTMAKKLEIGFIFPNDVIIKKKEGYSSTYTDDKQQIVRYERDHIHGKTEQPLSTTLDITPMKEGEYTIKTFVKGENIKAVYRYFVLRIKK
jgi:hypothetical protein